MKALCIVCALLIVIPGLLCAEEVTRDDAEAVARSWMLRQGWTEFRDADIRTILPHRVDGVTVGYVVSFMPDGFVVVAGDDIAHPVVMFARSGTVSEVMPPQLGAILDAIGSDIIRSAGRHSTAVPHAALLWEQLRSGVHPPGIMDDMSSPLLQTRWNQSWPYNKYCPEDPAGPSGHCYTGCGAVALAQVLRYYRAPGRGNGAHAYHHPDYGSLSATFEDRWYAWQDMPSKIYSSSPEGHIDEVATLLYHCGVAVEMDYGPYGSSSSMPDLRDAFVNHFRFHSSATYIKRSDFEDGKWHDILRHELDGGRPIVYSGHSSSLGAGHMFIIDAYNAEGYYHCNWGWGGSYDGWFYLHDLTPGSREFDTYHAALTGLLPIAWMVASTGVNYDLHAVDACESAVWACGDAGSVILSTDAGWTWSPVSSPSGATALHSVSVVDASCAWVLGLTETASVSALWRTTDAGQSWTKQLSVDPAGGMLRAVSCRDADNAVAYGDPVDAAFRVWRTSDGGTTWLPVDAPSLPQAASGEHGGWDNLSRYGSILCFGTTLPAGTARAVCSTDDGTTWSVSPMHEVFGRSVLRTAASSSQQFWALGVGGIVSVSGDGGMTWGQGVATGMNTASSIASGGEGIITVVGEGGVLRYSTDAGITWNEEGLPSRSGMRDVEVNPDGQCWIVGDGGIVFVRIKPSSYIAPPEAPIPLLPEEGADDITIPATFEWEGNERAWSYEIQVSKLMDFSDITYQRTNILGTSCRAYYLTVNTDYFWRVRAENGGGPGEWSAIRTFRTVPGKPVAPELSTPIDGAVGEPTEVSVTWLPVDGASSYHLRVYYKEFNIYVTFAEKTQLTDTSFTLTNLERGVTYYWRVRAHNSMGYSSWTSTWTFTTMPLLSAPELLAPANTAEEISLAPTLEWQKQEALEFYHVQVAEDEQFDVIAYEHTEIQEPPLGVSNLKGLTQYYWRVRGIVAGASSPWSEVWSFTTCPALSAPVLLTPPDLSSGVSVDVTLSWNAVSAAESYDVDLALDGEFSSIVLHQQGIPDPSLPVTGLHDTTQYFWRVRAVNDDGCSRYSEPWTFTTKLTVPDVPQPRSPENHATNVLRCCSFSWEAVPRSDMYRLQVGTDDQLKQLFCDTSGLLQTVCMVQQLHAETQYYWRVAAGNSSGYSDWSEVYDFITGTVVGVHPLRGGDEVSVPQLRMYPNPFRDGTTVRYFIPRPGAAELIVHDILGHEVWRKSMRHVTSGWHELYVPAVHLRPGIYHCALASSGGTLVRRMVILK